MHLLSLSSPQVEGTRIAYSPAGILDVKKVFKEELTAIKKASKKKISTTVVPKPKRKMILETNNYETSSHPPISKKPRTTNTKPAFSLLVPKPIEAVPLTQVSGSVVVESQTEKSIDTNTAEEPNEKLKLIVVPAPPKVIIMPTYLPHPRPTKGVVIRDPIQSTTS